jgi:seryl-tRNA synthetase
MTDPVFALTMESAQAWAMLILAIASAIGSVLAAFFAARAKANSGEVKAAIGVNGEKNAPTIQQQVKDIHTKADKAIEQNASIEKQTDGHYTALTEILSQLVEQMKERPAVVVPVDVLPPRQVRKEDLQRATDAVKKDPA